MIPRPSNRKQSNREISKEREWQRKASKIQEMAVAEHGCESPEVEKDVTALGLLQGSAGSDQERASDSEESENGEVLVSEGEELEEVDESPSRKLMASAVEQSRCT